MLIESQKAYFLICLIAVKLIVIPNKNRMSSVDLVLLVRKYHMKKSHITKRKLMKEAIQILTIFSSLSQAVIPHK